MSLPTQSLRRCHAPRLAAAFALAALLGCSLPYPFSKVELAERNSARALVHYLRQPGSSAAVCGRRRL